MFASIAVRKFPNQNVITKRSHTISRSVTLNPVLPGNSKIHMFGGKRTHKNESFPLSVSFSVRLFTDCNREGVLIL